MRTGRGWHCAARAAETGSYSRNSNRWPPPADGSTRPESLCDQAAHEHVRPVPAGEHRTPAEDVAVHFVKLLEDAFTAQHDHAQFQAQAPLQHAAERRAGLQHAPRALDLMAHEAAPGALRLATRDLFLGHSVASHL